MVTMIGVALTAAVLAVTLKQVNPVFALLTALAAGLWLLHAVMAPAGELVSAFHAIAQAAGIEGTVYLPVVKTVGIAAAVRVAGAICKDAGQGALSAKLELAGAVAALAACLPLFERVLSVVTGML